ncbi:acetyl-CoA carboxylase biotin carboxyl carrier protein [Altererythrobacter soli]|uniref:Biotin carboxyl carrier protein of acetyl-CoA carboxylase n=1 Tax=Croceibacterium soli TaxID=1739690 RepID=A0A6I4URI2_9SPHN|nr:biotin/lipoyl-containing protein [Croceibacterium soli]MXP41401.1 acetyl-CoA carboxylase biotin carboxyl carrier protein [Croceibacterium soli]
MSLTGADIAEIAKLLDESHFTDLRLEMGSLKLRIRRDGGRWSPGYDEDEAEEVRSAAPAPSSANQPEPPPLGQEAGAARAGEIDVPAPLLGNFYSAPRPGDPPFVQPGDKVNEETVIGIIEVMKLMNPIRAGVTGTVVAILAENGTAVEDGQPLIRVKVDG